MAKASSGTAGNHASTGSFAPPPATYTLRLVQVRSFLILTRRSVIARSGGLEELRAFARGVWIKNLLLGWWGFPFGVVWTPAALVKNHNALQQLGVLAASGTAAAGWFPDPSARHGARYWDGAKWTDRVSDVATDALPQNTPT